MSALLLCLKAQGGDLRSAAGTVLAAGALASPATARIDPPPGGPDATAPTLSLTPKPNADAAPSGFDWGSGGIGAAGIGAFAIALAGTAGMRRRSVARQPPITTASHQAPVPARPSRRDRREPEARHVPLQPPHAIKHRQTTTARMGDRPRALTRQMQGTHSACYLTSPSSGSQHAAQGVQGTSSSRPPRSVNRSSKHSRRGGRA